MAKKKTLLLLMVLALVTGRLSAQEVEPTADGREETPPLEEIGGSAPLGKTPTSKEIVGSAPLGKTPPLEEVGGSAPLGKEEEPVQLNLQDTDINLVLELYSKLTGLTIVKDRQIINLKVTVMNPGKLPKEEAIRVIESALELNGISVIKSDNIIKVVMQRDATRKSIETRIPGGPHEESEEFMVTQIIPLKNIDAPEIVGNLQPLISANGNVFANSKTNTLIITDVASNITRLSEIIAQLDVEIAVGKLEARVIELKYANETELAEVLNKIFSPTDVTAARYTARRTPARRTTAVQPAGGEVSKDVLEDMLGKVKLVPYERLKAIVVITTGEYFGIVQSLVEKLDVAGADEGAATRVYFLKYASAKEISKTLNTLFGGIIEEESQATTAGGTRRYTTRRPTPEEEQEVVAGIGSLEGKIKMVPDERTNSLVITTSPRNFAALEELLKELDTVTPQVLIEAWIVEVTLNDETKFGVESTFFDEFKINDKDYSGTVAQNFGLQDFTSTTPALQGVSSWFLKDDLSVAGFLNIVSSVTSININSAPRILSSNNKEAIIRVGEDVPIVKDVRFDSVGNPIFSYEYKESGIKLTVTPVINTEGDVALKIKQEVDTIIGTFTDPSNPPIFGAREAETSVLLKDGQTIVIGGLIKDDKTKTTTKVPFIGSIPILGIPFRSESTVDQKTELMVFITPRVIYSADQAKKVTKDEEDKLTSATTPSKEKAEVCYKDGMRYYREGNYDASIIEFKKTIELNPGHETAILYMELARDRMNKEISSERESERKLEEKLIKVRVKEHYESGIKFYRNKEYTRALSEMKKVLALNPKHSGAGQYMKKINALMNKVEISRTDRLRAEKAIEKRWTEEKTQIKEDTHVYYKRGVECYNEKDYECCATEMEKVLRLEPGHKGAALWLEKAQYQLGRIEKIVEDVKGQAKEREQE